MDQVKNAKDMMQYDYVLYQKVGGNVTPTWVLFDIQ